MDDEPGDADEPTPAEDDGGAAGGPDADRGDPDAEPRKSPSDASEGDDTDETADEGSDDIRDDRPENSERSEEASDGSDDEDDLSELEKGNVEPNAGMDLAAMEEGTLEEDDDEDTDLKWTPPYLEDDYDAGAYGEGPGEDAEMPLADHIEEMLKRLAVVVAVAGIVSLATFPFAERLINLLWNSILPAGELTRPRLYGVLELLLTKVKVASLAGLIVALPVAVYETYQFMRPGLYPHERRYYLAAVPTSLVLALVGVSFAYFIVLPAIFTYFLYYSQDVATIGFALGKTFDLILLLMGYLAVVFQIPLFVMLAMMMGLVTRQWLADRRLLFWGGFLGLSFLVSPDPTGMAPVVVAITMIVLFEGTLLLSKWAGRTGRSRAR